MGRQLYRVYLYGVSIALLIFGAVALALLLNTLLAFTPLRGTYRPIPGQNELVQGLVFTVVAWVIVGVLGGVHYRLIRKDIARDPTAATGAVRAFFVNIPEGLATLIAVFTIGSGFSALAYQDPNSTPDTATPFAIGIAALLVAALLELERRRSAPGHGAAIAMQRLHLYGVPALILVVTALTSWESTVRATLGSLLLRVNVYNPLDPSACSPTGPEVNIIGPCTLPDARFLWLSGLVSAGAIGIYALFVRGDVHSIIRTVLHLGSFTFGLLYVLIGAVRAFELLLRGAFGMSIGWGDIVGLYSAQYDFVSPLTFGVLVALVYGLWLRAEAARLPLGAVGTTRTLEAITAILFAVPFWWGVGRLLNTAFEWLGFGASSATQFPAEWAGALALVITGLVYVALTIQLLRMGVEGGAPRGAHILALLAGGVVTGAAGLAVALYTVVTAALSVPVTNWQQVARAGTSALIVGVVMAGIYGWIALREHTVESLFVRHPATPTKAVTPAGMPEAAEGTIEQVLDAYATHSISRSEASERIRELTHAHV